MTPAPARRIGATDAAALLGLSPWANAADVYGRIVLGVTSPLNSRMARGTASEAAVLARYVEESGAVLVPHPRVVQHATHAWATCSPDAVSTTGLVEIKTATVWVEGKWSEGPPAHYVVQVLYSLWVTGLARGTLYAAFGVDRDDGAFTVERCASWTFRRDAELEADFERVGGEFWRRNVLARVPPAMAPLKNIRAYKAALKAVHAMEAVNG